jgi:hypothetical protein
MPLMRGTVTIVQEGRFQLTDEAGVSHLFVLGTRAGLEPAQLAPLAARQARIGVRFKPGRGLLAGVVEAIHVEAFRPEDEP